MPHSDRRAPAPCPTPIRGICEASRRRLRRRIPLSRCAAVVEIATAPSPSARPAPAAQRNGNRDRLAAAPTPAEPELGPISPELILVSPPEIAAAARRLIPEPGSFGRPPPSPEAPDLAVGAAAAADGRAPHRLPRSVVAATVVAAAFSGFAVGRLLTRPEATTIFVPTILTEAATTRTVEAASAFRPAPVSTASTVSRPRSPTTVRAGTATSRTATPQTFAWPPVPHAGAYVVTFYFNGRSVLRTRVTTARLRLPSRIHLGRGRYRWRVDAVLADGSRHLAPIIDSTFVVP
jgi:hypothetical protein